MTTESIVTHAGAVAKSRLGIAFGKIKELPDSTPQSPHGKVRVRVRGFGCLLEYKVVNGKLTAVFPWEVSALVRVADPDEKAEIEAEVLAKLQQELENLAEEL